MRNFKPLLFLLFTLSVFAANGQDYFHRNRKAFQMAKYKKTTKRYASACEIFEKKRTRGEHRPFLSFGRKPKRKLAEQD